jgi:hypothetical protein
LWCCHPTLNNRFGEKEDLSIVAAWHLIEKDRGHTKKKGRKITFAEEKLKMKHKMSRKQKRKNNNVLLSNDKSCPCLRTFSPPL